MIVNAQPKFVGGNYRKKKKPKLQVKRGSRGFFKPLLG
jgi:hypothetical protein